MLGRMPTVTGLPDGSGTWNPLRYGVRCLRSFDLKLRSICAPIVAEAIGAFLFAGVANRRYWRLRLLWTGRRASVCFR